MKEYIIYTVDGTPINLSQKRYLIAKHYVWHVQSYGKGRKILVTYFGGKSHYFTDIVFGQRIRRKDLSNFDYTKRNILEYGNTERTTRLGRYNNISGYYYVYKSGEKWMVTIRINNVAKYKGKFKEKDDAAIIADYWSLKYAGVNSYLNFRWASRRTLTKRYNEIMIKNGYSINDFID